MFQCSLVLLMEKGLSIQHIGQRVEWIGHSSTPLLSAFLVLHLHSFFTGLLSRARCNVILDGSALADC